MLKRMLIDASHPEETRVIVLDGQKVEEFDFEAASKRPLKGNIYLAKVTRVEPSLQAAFVEYGGNRQGFLAFSEIHPDYYQIPVADRMALLAEQEAEARRRSEDEFESIETASAPALMAPVAEVERSGVPYPDHATVDAEPVAGDQEANAEKSPSGRDERTPNLPEDGSRRPDYLEEEFPREASGSTGEDNEVPETLQNAESATGPRGQSGQSRTLQGARPPQRWMRRRHYKIQEVIKRRQIILVQVVKEERGTKGAALTTYLSLAGRYCVLMPNTPRGGGISRKITSATDRKRLKAAAQALELPEGMGLIIRTAGENRTKTEIKRDYEYLLRMWDTVRELTLKSNAPACVYEEGDLIKRAIRDLYNKDVFEIVVEGDEGYRNAKDFMRMLMPSHAKNVKPYKEAIPLFQRHHIEAQLDAMFSSTVTLRSGGYIVINQAEALVAIDVNSGRATREHSIEDTAYKTNLEAAEEIARQLRLRDLAGLIVIDFIDMEDSRNDRNVEKRLRDCAKNDRARVQIGKISQFGLLEMSRQRLRAGVVAGSTVTCPNCGGQGIVRSVESTALRLLRSLEEEAQRQRATAVIVRAQPDVTIYTLNQKRRELSRIENEYGLTVQFEPKDGIVAGTFELDRVGYKSPEERAKTQPVSSGVAHEPSPTVEEALQEPQSRADGEIPLDETRADHIASQPAGEGKRGRRRRRRGRDRSTIAKVTAEQATPKSGGSPILSPDLPSVEVELLPSTNVASAHPPTALLEPGAQPEGTTSRRRKRRRRRGRHGTKDEVVTGAELAGSPEQDSDGNSDAPPKSDIVAQQTSAHASIAHESPVIPNAPSEPVWSLAQDTGDGEHVTVSETAQSRATEAPSDEIASAQQPAPSSQSVGTCAELENPRPARKGWWQRPFRSRE